MKMTTLFVRSEDFLGELPIKISQERWIKRSHILIKIVMTPTRLIKSMRLICTRWNTQKSATSSLC